MNETAMKINTQDLPEIPPLKPVEPAPDPQKQNEVIQESKQASKSVDPMSAKDVEEMLEAFQDLSKAIQTKLSFSVDDSNNEIVVKVYDKQSNELIRQFPSEEMLALQDKMTDLAGFLLNENV